jgi:hypothetical protein
MKPTKSFAAALLLMLVVAVVAGTPVYAALVIVSGEATVSGTDSTRLASINFPANVGDAVEFDYSYETTADVTTGSFALRRLSTGETIALSPTDVFAKITEGIPTVVPDQYLASVEGVRHGVDFQIAVELLEPTSPLAAGPAVYLNTHWRSMWLTLGVEDDGGIFPSALDAQITSLQAVVVPEPASFCCLPLALAVLARSGRRSGAPRRTCVRGETRGIVTG